MLTDYHIGPVLYPIVFFDARFAVKYGIEEAILFNRIAHDVMVAEQLAGSGYDRGYSCQGVKESGRFWVRFTEKDLYHSLPELFTLGQAKRAVDNLESSNVILIRPSTSGGCYWVALGDGK